MLFSLSWLEERLPGASALPQLADTLTDIGLENESEERIQLRLNKVVAGRVLEVAKGKAGSARACQVDIGAKQPVTVICSAPNLRSGMMAPLAKPGAKLPGGMVERRKVGKVESEGMLCSEAELGLGTDATGLLELEGQARPGTALPELVETADHIYEVAVTPNRGDWLSMYGIARELAAKTGKKIKQPQPPQPKAARGIAKHAVAIAASARQACPKFTCLPLHGVDAAQPTPLHIRARLQRCGVRPVSIVVDITNYVMLEYGQPLHAFDRGELRGGITVRFARPGEKLELLDGTRAKLNKQILVVADTSGARALAGVMGGLDSGVTERTTEVLLEAAHFVPGVIRGRTRVLKLSSEAASRFERGVDPALPELALARAAELIMRYCGGQAGPRTIAGATPAKAKMIPFKLDDIVDIIGVPATKATATKRLKALGFEVKSSGKGMQARPPSWRFDVERWQDLAEEIVRLGGYDAIPITMPRMEGGFAPQAEPLLAEGRARDVLVAAGFNEMITFAFVNPQWEQDYYGNAKPLRLANPLGPEHSVMRSGLFGGLLDRANYNHHRRQDSLRLFEIGRCFPPKGGQQPTYLAGLCWGPFEPNRWNSDKREQDFYDVRGAIESLLPGAALEFVPGPTVPALHPDSSAQVRWAGRSIGCAGMLHPGLLRKGVCELGSAPALFELDLEFLKTQPCPRRFESFSQLPLVRRDLALLAPQRLPAGELVKSIRQISIPELVNVEIFDSFAGGSLPAGQRSVGLRLTLQGGAANLVEDRINEIVAAAAACLQREHDVQLRG